ncbi:MAG: hypothetical protein WBM02_07035 [bacterium]
MKSKISVTLFCSFIFICLFHSTLSLAFEFAATAETEKVRYRIGDRITLLIRAETSDEMRVLFPGETVDVSPFTLLNYQILAPERTLDGLRETLELTLSIYRTGEFEIPAIEVVWVSKDGTKHSALTQKQYIVIESILNKDDAQPRATKPVVDVKARGRFVIAALTGIILSILLIYLAVRQIGKWKRREIIDSFQPEPLKPADQEALEALEELRTSQYLAKGEIKKYFIRLTEILKTYIGRRFAFNAIEHTTGEIRIDMRGLSIDPGIQTDTLQILDLADMVKFAKFLPTDEQCRQAMDDTEKIIHRTQDVIGSRSVEFELKSKKAASV